MECVFSPLLFPRDIGEGTNDRPNSTWFVKFLLTSSFGQKECGEDYFIGGGISFKGGPTWQSNLAGGDLYFSKSSVLLWSTVNQDILGTNSNVKVPAGCTRVNPQANLAHCPTVISCPAMKLAMLVHLLTAG